MKNFDLTGADLTGAHTRDYRIRLGVKAIESIERFCPTSSHLAEKRLHRVPASPEFKRPVFLAYRESLEEDLNLKLATDALRQVLCVR
jgi:hypothetical protein